MPSTDQSGAIREKQIDSWFRQLNDGRVEIMCRAPGYRLRVKASEDEAWAAVELFESWTGLTVTSERRPRRKPSEVPGQMLMAMPELESEGN